MRPKDAAEHPDGAHEQQDPGRLHEREVLIGNDPGDEVNRRGQVHAGVIGREEFGDAQLPERHSEAQTEDEQRHGLELRQTKGPQSRTRRRLQSVAPMLVLLPVFAVRDDAIAIRRYL